MAQLVFMAPCKDKSEMRGLSYLKEHLPDEWVVLGNPEVITQNGGSLEADALIIADNCIWLVDFKSFKKGSITGDATTWFLPSGKQIPNPLQGVSGRHGLLHKARVLNGRISSIQSRYQSLRIEALVILINDHNLSGILNDPRIQRNVACLSNVSSVLSQISNRYNYPLDDNKRRELVSIIAGPSVVAQLSEPTAHISQQTLSLPALHQLFSVTIEGDDFYRFFDSDEYRWILLGKQVLQGAQPTKLVNGLGNCGVRLSFSPTGVRLLSIDCRVLLNQIPLRTEQLLTPNLTYALDINGIHLRVAVEVADQIQ